MADDNDNFAIVRAQYEAYLSGDVLEALAYYDRDVVWDASRLRAQATDVGGVFHGLAGVGEFFSSWGEAWESFEFDHDAYRSAGDWVIVRINQRARGRASGAEVELGPYAQCWRLRDGLIIEMRLYPDLDGALAELG